MAVNRFVQPVQSNYQRQVVTLPIPEIFQSGQLLQKRQDAAVEQLDAFQDTMVQAAQGVDEADRELFSSMSDEFAGRIDSLADSGYYGDTSTMRKIRGMGREFVDRYTPFQQQYTNLQNAREAIRSNESFTAEDKDRRLAALQNVGGLQLGEDGRVDRSSIFQGREFANRVNFFDIADAAVKGIAANEKQSGYILDPQTGLLVNEAGQFVSEQEAAKIAMAGLNNSPEAIAFLEDQVRLKEELEGPMSEEEKVQFVHEHIADAVEQVTNKYAYYRQGYDVRTSPLLSAGKAKEPGGNLLLHTTSENRAPSQAIVDTPKRVAALQTTLTDLQTQLANASEADKPLIQRAIRDTELDLKHQQSIIAAALGDDPDAEDIALLVDQRPGAPSSIPDARIKAIEHYADVRLASPYAANQLKPGQTPIQSEEEQAYFEEYSSWRDLLTPKQREQDKRLRAGLEQLAQENASQVRTQLLFPTGGNKITNQLDALIDGNPSASGMLFMDSNGVEIYEDDERPVGWKRKWGGFEVTPDNGQFVAFLKAQDPETDEWKDFKVSLPTRDSFGRITSPNEIIARDLIDEVGVIPREGEENSAKMMRQAAFNLRMPDIINDLSGMPSGSSLYRIGQRENLLENITIGDRVFNTYVKRLGNRYVLYDQDTDQPLTIEKDGTTFIADFPSVEGLNNTLIKSAIARQTVSE